MNKIVSRMYNTKSSIVDMKPKDTIKRDTVSLDKTYPKETVLHKMVYIDIYINSAKSMKIKKDGQQTLSGVKIHID